MERNSWIRVALCLAPQDRRRIEKKEMYVYVSEFLIEAFAERIFLVDQCNNNGVVVNITNTTPEEVEAKVEELKAQIELSSASFFTIVDVAAEIDQTAGVTENTEESEGLTQYEDDFFFGDEEDEEPIDPGDKLAETDKTNAWDRMSWDEERAREVNGKINEIMLQIERLMGAGEFKKLCRDIRSIASGDERKYLRNYFENCGICFFVEGGDGFSTYTKLLAQLLSATGTKNLHLGDGILEIKKNVKMKDMLERFEHSTYHNDCISYDLTFLLDDINKEEFRSFIRELARRHGQGDKFPIFKVPLIDEESMERLKDVLSSAMPMIYIRIPRLSSREYALYMKECIEDYNYDIDENLLEDLEMIIDNERRKQRFYGFVSMNRLVSDILFEKNLVEEEDEELALKITEKDLKPLLTKCNTEKLGLETLDKLIGIEDIRKRVDEIVVQIEMARKMDKDDRPCMHMIFSGNPGTGKTTIARLLGLVLKEKGLLSRGLFFERSGRDFVGKYIGETAPITNAICRDAYGSVLFIDEAYTLYREGNTEKDYGREALDTLLAQMENHRQDLVVIMAGYPDEMKHMLEANPGLKSRIPYEIAFRNYTREELTQIFMSMVDKKYDHSEELESVVAAYFDKLSDEDLNAKSFANARYVRNLFERTVTKAGLRLQAEQQERISDEDRITLTASDFELASGSNEYAVMQKKNKTIGFV